MTRPLASQVASGPTLVVLAAGQAKRYGGVKPLAPVGLAGEAVIDLLGGDAIAAGFGRIVLVVGPETGPAIRYHVERTWPSHVDVHLAVQEAPRGTADAVVAAMQHLGTRAGDAEPFGVANADDLYGHEGLGLLADLLRADEADPNSGAHHAIVCYRLRHTLIGDAPVTRGVCRVEDDGLLHAIDERRKVTPVGGRIEAHDDKEPAELDGDAWVSVNLWGLGPQMVGVLQEATAGGGAGEVLLPEVVGDLLAGRRVVRDGPVRFRVVRSEGRCIGVTHPGDLALVQADLAMEVGRGERPAQVWPSTPGR